MNFILRHYDTDLLAFELQKEGMGGFVCTILSIDEKSSHLLPSGLELTGAGLLSWLKSRVIPQNREFVDRILSSHGLDHNDILGIIKFCLGLSLNDSYWVVPVDDDGGTRRADDFRFKDFNLYENDFEEALSLIAYTGHGSVRPSDLSPSPEFTTNGNLRKGWRKRHGGVVLSKGGSSGGANTGNEPYSEFYASQIAEAMELDHVPYELEQWKGTLCSTCGLFTDIDHAFVPAGRFFLGESNLSAISSKLQAMGEENFFQPFCDMMIFDALTYNTDRHLGNFGLMIDNQTNKPYKLAPIFDNGLALFPSAMKDDFERLEDYAGQRTPVFGQSFDALAIAFITERQRKKLRRLINFAFTRHKTYNLPEWRLKRLETFLQNRLQFLLKLRGFRE